MRISLMFFCIVLLSNCTGHDKNPYLISGDVMNLDSLPILVKINGITDTLTANQTGKLVYEQHLDKPVKGTLVHDKKRKSIILEPNKTLEFQVDLNEWDKSFVFTGDLKYENEYFAERLKRASIIGKCFFANYTKSPKEFLSIIDSLIKTGHELVEQFQDMGLAEEFAEIEKQSIKFGWYAALADYPGYHRVFAPEDTFPVPSSWFDFTSEIDFSDIRLMEIESALTCIGQLMNEYGTTTSGLSRANLKRDQFLIQMMNYIDSVMVIPEMIDYFQHDAITRYLFNPPDPIVNYIIEEYIKNTKNEENKSEIQKLYYSWLSLKKGENAPQWSLLDQYGKEHSLSDFKGKYVFLDFWATWCAPCIAEIPHLEELVKKFKDQNIQFISISIDKNKQAWEKMIMKDKPIWLQLHDNTGIEDKYAVKHIPTFILIDSEGKIYDASTPKPSSDDILSLLNNLLK